MHRKILESIREFIGENHMLVPGDRVIIGLSGGADSVSLLMILHELKNELNIELFAVHVHHGLRGEEADRDSAYAQELSENLGVPFVCVHANVAEYARVNGMSEEEAGRHLRYRILEEQRLAHHASKIAVAHHADDQAETVLYNLFRGSGLKGIGGMKPVRDTIIRPLLSVTRKEILAYLEEKEISYCVTLQTAGPITSETVCAMRLFRRSGNGLMKGRSPIFCRQRRRQRQRMLILRRQQSRFWRSTVFGRKWMRAAFVPWELLQKS